MLGIGNCLEKGIKAFFTKYYEQTTRLTIKKSVFIGNATIAALDKKFGFHQSLGYLISSLIRKEIETLFIAIDQIKKLSLENTNQLPDLNGRIEVISKKIIMVEQNNSSHQSVEKPIVPINKHNHSFGHSIIRNRHRECCSNKKELIPDKKLSRSIERRLSNMNKDKSLFSNPRRRDVNLSSSKSTKSIKSKTPNIRRILMWEKSKGKEGRLIKNSAVNKSCVLQGSTQASPLIQIKDEKRQSPIMMRKKSSIWTQPRAKRKSLGGGLSFSKSNNNAVLKPRVDNSKFLSPPTDKKVIKPKFTDFEENSDLKYFKKQDLKVDSIVFENSKILDHKGIFSASSKQSSSFDVSFRAVSIKMKQELIPNNVSRRLEYGRPLINLKP